MRRRRETGFAAIAVLALAAAWLLGHATPQRALLGYLAAWLFCLAVPLGSMTMLAIHTLTGGRWGVVSQPLWLRGNALLPVVGVLWLPLLIGASVLLPWARAGQATAVPRWYLNLPFLYLRAAVCFALWCAIAWRQRRRPGGPGFAGASLVMLLLTITITAVDWIMSLVPSWHSTALGMLLMTSYVTVALALAVAWWTTAGADRAQRDEAGLQLRRDLGNLLLASVLGWAYLAFMDYLTAWIADLPSETVWYLPRLRWPWCVMPIAMLALQLALPMALLLPRRGKHDPRVLKAMALTVLAMQGVNMLWLVLPGLRDAARPLAWSDACVAIGLALVMLAAWRWSHSGERREVSP